MMRLSWMVAIAFGLAPAGAAMAQGLIAPSRTYGGDAYQSPQQYRPPSPSTLDKNYGLPNIPREGVELPKPRAPQAKTDTTDTKADAPAAMPDEKAAGPSVPDFFAGSPEIALPKRRPATESDSDTPLYTTTDGSAMTDTDTTSDDTLAKTGANDKTVR